MVEEDQFTPDWLSPPGETIATILTERGVTTDDLARRLQQSGVDVNELIDGRAAITVDVARQLAIVLGASESFWTKRELHYRQDLARLKRQSLLPACSEWLDDLPVKDMVESGWIRAKYDQSEIVVALLRFFGVPSVDSWHDKYKDVLQATAFKTSPSFASNAGAVAAWLRQGEIAASSLRCNPRAGALILAISVVRSWAKRGSDAGRGVDEPRLAMAA